MHFPHRFIAVVVLALVPAAAAAGTLELSVRELGNVTHFSGVQQAALEGRLPSRQRLPGTGLALDWIAAAGAVVDRTQASSFVSIGRVLTVALSRVLELQGSFSPTWMEADRLNGRDFGGHFHFTTALALRFHADPRRRFAVALRGQHTSNGGLDEANPGLDLAGIELTWRLDALPR